MHIVINSVRYSLPSSQTIRRRRRTFRPRPRCLIQLGTNHIASFGTESQHRFEAVQAEPRLEVDEVDARFFSRGIRQ